MEITPTSALSEHTFLVYGCFGHIGSQIDIDNGINFKWKFPVFNEKVSIQIKFWSISPRKFQFVHISHKPWITMKKRGAFNKKVLILNRILPILNRKFQMKWSQLQRKSLKSRKSSHKSLNRHQIQFQKFLCCIHWIQFKLTDSYIIFSFQFLLLF